MDNANQIGIPSIAPTPSNMITLLQDGWFAATRYGLKRTLAGEKNYIAGLTKDEISEYGGER